MNKLLLLLSLLSSGCLLVTGILSADCGDGFVDASEECDDANPVNDDGCESDCTLPVCGNGVVDTQEGEECDDGNLNFGDGCDPTCAPEVSEFTVADINGTNVNNARFATFSNSVSLVSLTNGVNIDLSVLRVVISDKENFCELIAQDPAALNNLPDLDAIEVIAFRRGPVGANAYLSGQFVSTNDNFLTTALNTTDATISTFVGATITKRVGGVNQILAGTPIFNTNDGKLSIEEVSPEKLKAQMTVTITGERVQGPFDFEENPFPPTEPPNIRTISVPLSVSVQNLSFCPSL